MSQRERVALLRAHDLQLTMGDVHNTRDMCYIGLDSGCMVPIDSHIRQNFGIYMQGTYPLQVIL